MENANPAFSEVATGCALPRSRPSEPLHYATRVKYPHERRAEHWSRQQGSSPALPVYKNRRQWFDRVVEIGTPLFPGYAFCPLDLKNQLPILTALGVLNIVVTGKNPLPTDSQKPESLRVRASHGHDVQPCLPLTGQKVRIETGPLRAVEGALVEVRGKSCLMVSISMLNRSFSATIEGGEAIPF